MNYGAKSELFLSCQLLALSIFEVLVVSCILFAFVTQTSAQTMSNDSYKLEQGKFESSSGSITPSPNKSEFGSGASSTTFFKGTNYTIHSESQTAFSFSISNTSVAFGKITPGEPIIRTNTLNISSPTGYEVMSLESGPLKASGSAQISDTSCDQGNCGKQISAKWDSPLTYGFGYRCDNLSGTDCTPDFKDPSYYRSFASLEKQDTPQVIMQNINPASGSTVQIAYKVNIPGNQTPGQYQNTVSYLAVPSLR